MDPGVRDPHKERTHGRVVRTEPDCRFDMWHGLSGLSGEDQRGAETVMGERKAGVELQRGLEPVREDGDVAQLGALHQGAGGRRERRADLHQQRLAVAHELGGGAADRQLLVREARL